MIEEFFFQIRIIAWKRSGAAGSAVESRTLSGAAGVRFGPALEAGDAEFSESQRYYWRRIRIRP
jgi:hypothetical protein